MNIDKPCPKCHHTEYECGEIRVAGGFWSKIFDVQNKKFFTISCEHCGYTEIFKSHTGTMSSVIDFFVG